MDTRTEIEIKIVNCLKSNNQDAISLIFSHYGKALFSVIYKVVQRKEESEEVLQDVLVKIWEKSDQYSADKGRLYTWMLNISRNAAIDMVRSKKYKQTMKSDPSENFVYTNASGAGINEDAIGVREIVSQLEEDEKQVIELSYFMGYSQSQIAEKINMPLGSVKTKMRYAMNKLRSKLKSDINRA